MANMGNPASALEMGEARIPRLFGSAAIPAQFGPGPREFPQ
jgi:hypothetical protein